MGARDTTALHIAEDRDSRFQPGGLLKLSSQFEGVVTHGMLKVLLGLLGSRLCLGGLGSVNEGLSSSHRGRISLIASSLSHRDDREIQPLLLPVFHRLDDGVQLVGHLGQQDDVSATSDARAEGQPAGTVAHDLSEDDAVVGMGGGVQPVDGLRGNLQCCREPEGVVGSDDVVVNRLGQMQDVQPGLSELVRVLGGATATQSHQSVKSQLLVILDDGGDHIPFLAVDNHVIDLVTASSQDGPADRQDA